MKVNKQQPKQKEPEVEAQKPKKELPAWMLEDEVSTDATDKGMCMSLWQPYSGLVISGAKRLEGRVWKSDFRGRLWIHAASKILEAEELAQVEAELCHADAAPPKSYPLSCLLGYIDVIDMISHEELLERRVAYKQFLDEGVPPAPHVEYYINEENESPYLFICRRPHALIMPLAMSGEHKIYPLAKSVHDAAKAQLALIKK